MRMKLSIQQERLTSFKISLLHPLFLTHGRWVGGRRRLSIDGTAFSVSHRRHVRSRQVVCRMNYGVKFLFVTANG